jgi:hypothetical protein
MPVGAPALAASMPQLDDRSRQAEARVLAAASLDNGQLVPRARDGNVMAWGAGVSSEPHRRLVAIRDRGAARQREPAMATRPVPIRAASPAPAEPPPAPDVVDAHLVWERQLAKLSALDLSLADEPALAAVCDRIARLEGLILGTRARTLEGAMAQVRRVAASMAHNDGDAREQRGLRLALATLARLRGA